MAGETNLEALIRGMKPQLNPGKYVFCTVTDLSDISRKDTLFEFKEAEGTTLVLTLEKAKEYRLAHDYVAAWITLEVHSALEAVGLTAAFSNALAAENISCNVVAGYYHDHIFVDYLLKEKAMAVLKELAR